ncbi:NAD(P)/FAD-dependent oxidoreductase [Halomonas cerina]|uniref:NADH dehydrogenase n=1 Tax=Halomonas cerina TaxID=447424 RepID=A0A839V6A0_9GAMM|nr:FAD-dependent oxidoreductase [Halomonas cerina]MBB3190942.1 NADH dehydrogenase [Halomonas cerina]
MSTRIVILGGGQAGYLLFSKLACRRDEEIEVTLIEQKARHELHHLLHLYAVGLVDTSEVSRPIDAMLRTTRLVHDEVMDIDPENNRVIGRRTSTPYDLLVIALGAMVDFRGVEGAAKHALPLRSIADAERIRCSVRNLVLTGSRHSIVVVGGGPSGVSLASTLADVTANECTSSEHTNLILVEDGDSLLKGWGPLFRDRTESILREKEVYIACGAPVERVDESSVTTSTGTFRSSLTLWTAGVKAPGCIRPEIFEWSQGGRLVVDDHCRVSHHSNIFAIGDVSYPLHPDGRSFPQCSQLAVTQAHYLAEALCSLVDGRPVEPFQCGDWRSSRALLVGKDRFVSQIDEHVLSGSFEEITAELSRLARTAPELLPYLDTLLKEELERRKRELAFLERKLAHELGHRPTGSV